MKFEVGIFNLVLKPEHDGDVFNLGIISKQLGCEIKFTADNDSNTCQCDSLMVTYKNLIEFLTTTKD